ncbi:MAG: APC family permease [Salibacteraceae bacterium]
MNQLKRSLSLTGIITVVVGSCIGAGIFFTPAEIAATLKEPSLILSVWALGGIMVLSGALTFAELGALFPKVGGIYQFLKAAYGQLVAYLYGWMSLLVIVSGTIAALSLVVAEYLSVVFPMEEGSKTVVALMVIFTVTLVNGLGAKQGERFSLVFAASKLLGIGLIVLIGFILGSWSINDYSQIVPPETGMQQPGLAAAIGLALVGVCFSFGGFQHASYLAGEAKSPKKDIPRGLVGGVVLVMLVYLLANLAYLRLLPVAQMATSKAVAADALAPVFGWSGITVALLIALSSFGTVGIYTLTAPRIYFAMSRDRSFFPFMGRLHSKTKAPVNAILIQSGWAMLLVLLWGNLKALVYYVVFADWVFLILAAFSIFLYRKRLPGQHRPYKTFGYPFTPAIFILVSLFIVGNTLIQAPISATIAVACLISGLLVYYLLRLRQPTTEGTKQDD